MTADDEELRADHARLCEERRYQAWLGFCDQLATSGIADFGHFYTIGIVHATVAMGADDPLVTVASPLGQVVLSPGAEWLSGGLYIAHGPLEEPEIAAARSEWCSGRLRLPRRHQVVTGLWTGESFSSQVIPLATGEGAHEA